MARSDIVAKLAELITEVSDLEPGTVAAAGLLRSYDLDSVRVIDLVVAIEEAFDVTVRNEDLGALKTVADLADYVERRQAAR